MERSTDLTGLAERTRQLFNRNDGDAAALQSALYDILREAVASGGLAAPKYTWLREVSRKNPAEVNWPLEVYRAVEAVRLSDIPHPPELDLTREQAAERVERLGAFWALRSACGALGPILAGAAMTTTPGKKTGAAVTNEQLFILEAINHDYPATVTLESLAALKGAPSRKTVSKHVKALLEMGLVDRPHGGRKGLALTDAGRLLLPGATQ